MSYSLFAKDKHSQEQGLHDFSRGCAHAQPTTPCKDKPCPPELAKLIRLRDALLVVKTSLSNSADLRSHIERQLLSNEVHERVLGKLAHERD